MGEVLCSTENSPFLIIDHITAKINRVCCAALAIGKRCMNVRENKLFLYNSIKCVIHLTFLINKLSFLHLGYLESIILTFVKMNGKVYEIPRHHKG